MSLMSGSNVDALILEAPYTTMGEMVFVNSLAKVRPVVLSVCSPSWCLPIHESKAAHSLSQILFTAKKMLVGNKSKNDHVLLPNPHSSSSAPSETESLNEQ